MSERYYAQYAEVPPMFLCGHSRAWMVFDRRRLDPQGACTPIALCVNRPAAFLIRNSLNSTDGSA